MSKMLCLVDCLLTSARNLHRCGRHTAARELLSRLARFRNLPPAAAVEIHTLLAELARGEARAARRHLAAAIALQPDSAELHFSLAQATEADPAVRPERARTHYLRALELAPENAHYWIEYAVYLLTIGIEQRGLKALRRAYALAGDNADIVGRVAATLREEGLEDEARSKLIAALLAHPRDRRFRALWQEHQFQSLYTQQQEQRQPAPTSVRQGPAILPFRAAPTTGRFASLGKRTLRFDPPAPIAEPKFNQRRSPRF
jgi:predicted Zn-dependent protease